jgi:hypothetical protein
MQFRLIYEGQIRPRQRAGLSDIHHIRQQLHPQIQRLWEFAPLSETEWLRFPPEHDYGIFEQIGHMVFAPLVSKRIDIVSELDIIFLRQQAPGQLISEGGDIDNRVKTLLDALRMPSKAEVQSLGQATDGDPNPMHCLLQDDALVTRINIETDRLLRSASQHEMVAIIQVKTKLSRVTMGNLSLSD